MTFLGLIVHNLGVRRFRTALTAMAVAIGVMAVMALGVLTFSLKTSATSILKLGQADMTIAKKGDNLFDSSIDAADVPKLATVHGITRATGVLIYLEKLDAARPQQIHLGLRAQDLPGIGVEILPGGAPFRDTDTGAVLIGDRLAASLHKRVGDPIRLFSDTEVPKTYRIAGLFTLPRADDLVRSYAENAIMLPLPELQAVTQRGDTVTLVFANIDKRVGVSAVKKALQRRFPSLGAVTGAQDYGLVDRNLQLVEAANTGGTILGAVIAISGVLNTALLSFLERIREFGVLRSIGWSRHRLLGLVLGEALVVALVGAFVGLVLGWAATNILQNLGSLKGQFQPIYTSEVFSRSLLFAGAVAFVGAAYPALRAAFLRPLEALRHE